MSLVNSNIEHSSFHSNLRLNISWLLEHSDISNKTSGHSLEYKFRSIVLLCVCYCYCFLVFDSSDHLCVCYCYCFLVFDSSDHLCVCYCYCFLVFDSSDHLCVCYCYCFLVFDLSDHLCQLKWVLSVRHNTRYQKLIQIKSVCAFR